MASDYERPDLAALSELEQLLRHLGDEVAGWRRRTLKAEAELQEARSRGGVLAGPELLQARQRAIELEVENQALRHRIEAARERLRALSSRLAFLETEEGAA
jgi:predicted  nucleic acid-binding Zn-ribbon protein